MERLILTSWQPEGAWLTLLLVLAALAALIAGVGIARAGRPGGRLAAGVMLGLLVVVGAAAAARIQLAVDRGRSDLDIVTIVTAYGLTGLAALVLAPGVLRDSASSRRRAAVGGLLAVGSVCMLVVAVFDNVEIT